MDRLHLEPGPAPPGAARDLRRRAARHQHHRPALDAPDGHAVGPRHRQRGRPGHPGQAASDRSRRQVLSARGCLRNDQPRRRQHVPEPRSVHGCAAGRQSGAARRQRLRVLAGESRRRHQAERSDVPDGAAKANVGHGGEGLVQRLHPRAHELGRQPAPDAGKPDDDVARRGSGRADDAGGQPEQSHPRLPGTSSKAAVRIRFLPAISCS